MTGLTKKQVELVKPVVAAVSADVPVHGAFCFVRGDFPLFGTPRIAGHHVLHRRSLTLVNADGSLDLAAAERLVEVLAAAFPGLNAASPG